MSATQELRQFSSVRSELTLCFCLLLWELISCSVAPAPPPVFSFAVTNYITEPAQHMTNTTTSSASSMTRWLTELEGRSDPRVSDWPLMSSPLPTVVLCLTYLLVVKVAGPLFMKDRPPYRLQGPMLAYNLFQVLFNGWIFLGQQT